MVINMDYKCGRHELGFQTIEPKPTSEELEKYYQDEYFSGLSYTYSDSYDEEETFHKYTVSKEAEFILQMPAGKMLDIGCGEGFHLKYFSDKGWDVTGLDFTDEGLKRHFPELEKNLMKGDVFQSLKKLVDDGKKKYDFIICDNVVEHVVEPIKFLNSFKKLFNENAICRFQLPNDDSFMQKYFVKNKLAEDNYWVSPPAHLSYFNKDTLEKTFDYCGYKMVDLLGDYPIELFLFNKDSNYMLNRNRGSNCHKARISFDNLLVRQSIESLVSFRQGCGRAGVGRNLIAYCSIK